MLIKVMILLFLVAGLYSLLITGKNADARMEQLRREGKLNRKHEKDDENAEGEGDPDIPDGDEQDADDEKPDRETAAHLWEDDGR
ncbi:MAG: hypothetical protein LIO86_13900 [Lachnospiraceae bacterium]|nr:hypothetical protein [Lachnospiraceae bacterium]